MNGFGTYYFPAGNSFTGTFSDDKFNGTGKYFYDNGLITEIITYKNNEVKKYGKILEIQILSIFLIVLKIVILASLNIF